MFSISLLRIFQWFLHYRYAVLAPVMIIEGPIATVIAGLLVSLGYLNALAVYGLALFGDVAGDLLLYFIGWLGRKRFLKKGTFLGIDRQKMDSLERHYNFHSGKTFLFGKWTQSVGFAILTAAGLAGVPLNTFLFYNFLGSVPKVLLFEVIGYYFGTHYQKINSIMVYVGAALLVAIAAIAAIILYKKKKK